MSTVRVAVVGLGYWGPNLVRNFNELACAEVVAVCDRDVERLELIERRYPAVQTHTSIDDVLADETIDAVALATPVSTHFPLGRAALEAGKHVFIEKPLAASTSECLELIQLAESRGLVLMPGHTFLYSPPVVAVRDLIESGELGELYFVSTSRVNLGLHQKDVSVTWDLAPHDFSILRYWLDEAPIGVRAITRGCPHGIDPYTHAVSDIYQDLTGEGSYHGKGIYDLQAFHRVLSGRFPEAHLLSHDLIEGAHVRVGLATDIELLDVFPSSYIAWWNRQHRWIRRRLADHRLAQTARARGKRRE